MINNKSDDQQFWTTYSTVLGPWPWGRGINTHCSHLKNVFKQKVRPTCVILFYFGKAVTVFSAQALRNEDAHPQHSV